MHHLQSPALSLGHWSQFLLCELRQMQEIRTIGVQSILLSVSLCYTLLLISHKDQTLAAPSLIFIMSLRAEIDGLIDQITAEQRNRLYIILQEREDRREFKDRLDRQIARGANTIIESHFLPCASSSGSTHRPAEKEPTPNTSSATMTTDVRRLLLLLPPTKSCFSAFDSPPSPFPPPPPRAPFLLAPLPPLLVLLLQLYV